MQTHAFIGARAHEFKSWRRIVRSKDVEYSAQFANNFHYQRIFLAVDHCGFECMQLIIVVLNTFKFEP